MRLELRTRSQHHENPQFAQAVDENTDQFVGRRVDPMEVLDYQQERSGGGERFQRLHQHLKQPALLPLRRHVDRYVLAFNAHRQQVREQRHDPRCVHRQLRNEGFELAQAGGVVVVFREARRDGELANDRRQRAALQVRRTVVPDAKALRVDDALGQHFGQARFAHARFGYDQHRLALALLRGLPKLAELVQFRDAVHERRSRRRAQRMKPAADLAFAEHLPRRHWRVESLEVVTAEVAVVEQAPRETPRRLGHHDLARARQRFEPRSQIGRGADGSERFAAVGKVADDDNPGRNADVNLEVLRGHRGPCRVRNLECGADRALRVVFVRARIAEVGEDPVADQPRHHAVMPLDDARRSAGGMPG